MSDPSTRDPAPQDTQRAFARAVQLLEHPHATVRCAAAIVVGSSSGLARKQAASRSFFARFSDHDVRVRFIAAYIGYTHHDHLVHRENRLRLLFNATAAAGLDPLLRRYAIDWISFLCSAFGEAAAVLEPALRSLAHEKDRTLAQPAITGLVDIGRCDEGVLDLMLAGAVGNTTAAQVQCLQLLARIGRWQYLRCDPKGAKMAPVLERLLTSRDPELRQVSAAAMVNNQHRLSVRERSRAGVLVRALLGYLERGVVPTVAELALRDMAVPQNESDDIIPLLAEAIRARRSRAAGSLLLGIGTPAALAALAGSLQSGGDGSPWEPVQPLSVTAVDLSTVLRNGMFAPTGTAAGDLAPFLDSTDTEHHAALSLVKLGSREAWDALKGWAQSGRAPGHPIAMAMRLLDHKTDRLVGFAERLDGGGERVLVAALAVHGGHAALPILYGFVRSRSGSLAEAATEELLRIGDWEQCSELLVAAALWDPNAEVLAGRLIDLVS